MRTRQLAAILVVLALGAPAVLAQEDVITLKDGRKQTGKITDYEFKTIKVSLKGGGTTVVKTDDVQSVDFEGAPKDYKDAVAANQAGRDDEALAKFQEVINNTKHRSVFRQEAFFQMAAVQFRLGKAEDGVATLKAMLADGAFPASRYLEGAQYQIYAGLERTDKVDEAVAFLDGEIARVGKIQDTAAVIDRLKLLKCRALVRKGDTKTALDTAQALAKGTGATAAEAKVVLGDLALAAKDAAAAEKSYREALAGATNPIVRAGCYNGLGQILYEKGFKDKKTDLIKEALLSFLRTVVQFPPNDGEPTGYFEAALLNAGICFHNLGELEKQEEAKNRYLGRARELFRRLRDNYPQSAVVGEAKARLERLGG